MAIIKIFDEKTNQTIEYFMEDRLKHNLDDKVKNALEKKDKDYVICVDGKEGCSPKGTKIMLSDGSWKNIEDIKIGDELISPQEDGTNIFSKVTELFNFKSEEIYDVYELHRQNRKLYSCSGNHYIPINKKELKTKKWKIVHYQAKDFFNKSKTDFHNTTTPTCFLIERFKDKENCIIEPYTLGVWLGDGHFSSKKLKKLNPLFNKQTIVKGHWRNFKSGTIWQREHPKNWIKQEYLNLIRRGIGITTNDFKIIEEISKFYPITNITQKKGANCKTYRFSLNGELSKLLSLYGLEGKCSGDKFIPKEALTSDVNYRKKLLAGLIDTDGTLSKSCSYSITTKSEQLAGDIEYLVYSLGGRCRINKIKKGIKSIGFIGEYFCVSFYLGNIDIPILLKRKQRDRKFFYLSANRTSIKLKKREGEQVYGFTVNSPSHWYVTDNYVITRNSGKTTVSLQIAKYVDPTFNLSRIVFSPEEFREAIYKAKKGQCVIYDEAFTGLSSRTSLSPVNKVLISLMMQMRQKNLFVILVLPTFFLLDKYAALFRTKALIHVYENRGRRGYFLVYNSKLKKYLYLFGKQTYSYSNVKVKSRFKGHFYGVFALGGKEIEDKYRRMKEKALQDSEKNPMSAGQIKYRNQRNICLYLLRKKLDLTYQELSNLLEDYDFPVSFVQIRDICAKFGDIEPKNDKINENNEENKEKSSKKTKTTKKPPKIDENNENLKVLDDEVGQSEGI